MIQISENATSRAASRQFLVAVRQLVLRCLRQANLPTNGRWVLTLRRQKQGTPHTPTFAVRRITEEHALAVEVKPGGNDTAHYAVLTPQLGVSAQEAYDALDRLFPASVSAEGQRAKRVERLEESLATVRAERDRLWTRLEVLDRREREVVDELQRLRSGLTTEPEPGNGDSEEDEDEGE